MIGVPYRVMLILTKTVHNLLESKLAWFLKGFSYAQDLIIVILYYLVSLAFYSLFECIFVSLNLEGYFKNPIC